MFQIAIVGGGIGGLFAALSIHHHCSSRDMQIDVYEQAAQYKEIGAGVAIGPNAATLVEKLGLLEETWKIAGKRGNIWFSFRRYDNGAEILTVPIPETGRMLQLPMHRAEFLDVLVHAVESRGAATLHTRKQCRKLEVKSAPCHSVVAASERRGVCWIIGRRLGNQEHLLIVSQDRGDTMLVTFADGTTTSAHLVIGADGIHSAVRSHYVVCFSTIHSFVHFRSFIYAFPL